MKPIQGRALALAAAIAIAVAALAESAVEAFVPAHWILAARALEIGVVVAAAILFGPLYRRIAHMFEFAALEPGRKRRKALHHLQQEFSSFTGSGLLVHHIIDTVDREMSTAGSAVYLRHGEYRAQASSYETTPSVDDDDALIACLRSSHRPADPRSFGSLAAGEVAFPMVETDELVGFLTLTPNAFDLEDDDLRALRELASSAAHALVALDSGLRERHNVARTNLPQTHDAFIGREKAIGEIAALVAGHRTVTLAGGAGIGKTRLAVRVAQGLLERFPDGVWYADLAPVTDPAFVAATVLSTIGVSEDAGRETEETLAHALHQRTALLILDNGDRVREEIARLANRVLRDCPQLHVLAAACGVLDIPGEIVYDVAPFDEGEGVALFAARALSAVPSFVLDAGNTEAAKTICTLLGGIPLAIALAAPHLITMTVAELRDRLDDRFAILTANGCTALSRQQTLDAVIEWSYDLLGPRERIALGRLSVFAGAFSLDAAAAIDEDSAPDIVARLVEASLLQADSRSGHSLLRLPGSIRAFARERLDGTGEAAAMLLRHSEYYCLHAGAADDDIAREYAEYRTALQWALDSGNAVSLGAALAAALTRYWTETGRAREARFWLERAVEFAGKAIAPETWARVLHALSVECYLAGEFERMATVSQLAESAYAALGDTEGQVRARSQIAMAAVQAGRYESAFELFESVAAVSRAVENRVMEAMALSNLAELMVDWKSDFARADRLYAQALEVGRDQIGANDSGTLLANWSQTAAYQNAFGRADSLVREALDLFRALDDDARITEQLARLAHYRVWAHDCTTARNALQEAMPLLRTSTHPLVIAGCAEACADLAVEQGDVAQSAALLGFCSEWRKSKNVALPNPMRERLEASSAKARSVLGERAYAQAWQYGCTRTLAQAIIIIESVVGGNEKPSLFVTTAEKP